MAALVHKIRPVPSGDDKQRTNSAQQTHAKHLKTARKTLLRHKKATMKIRLTIGSKQTAEQTNWI